MVVEGSQVSRKEKVFNIIRCMWNCRKYMLNNTGDIILPREAPCFNLRGFGILIFDFHVRLDFAHIIQDPTFQIVRSVVWLIVLKASDKSCT